MKFLIANISLLFFATQLCLAQVTREVVVEKDALIIKARVHTRLVKPNVNNKAFYFSFANKEIYKIQGGYQGHLLHGTYKVFNQENKLIIQGRHYDGLQDGIWKYWNTGGELKTVYTYKNGLRNGDFEEYNNGVISKKGKYKNGRIHGKIKIYEDGQYLESVKYKNGAMIAPKVKKEKVKNKTDLKKQEMEQEAQKLSKKNKKKNKKIW